MTTGIRTVLRFYIKVYIKLFSEIGLCITKPITKFKHRKTDNQSCSVIKETFDLTVIPEGRFGLTKFNDIGTFQQIVGPYRLSGNCFTPLVDSQMSGRFIFFR